MCRRARRATRVQHWSECSRAAAPAVGPDMPEGGDDTIGHDRLQVLGNRREGIEADRPRAVGTVYVDEIVRAPSRHMQQHGLGKIAVRIEQGEPGAGSEVLRDQIQQQCRFAGAGLADNVEVTVDQGNR
jgi:hypothetical protein